MPWAIFHRTFNYDFRPEMGSSIKIKPGLIPREFPSKVIEAAERANCAERVKSPTAAQKRAFKRAKRAE